MFLSGETNRSPHFGYSIMKMNRFLHVLVISILIGWMVTVPTLPASAQEGNPQTLELSSSGEGRAYAVEYSPDGRIIAVGSSLGIYLFDSSTLEMTLFIPSDSSVRTLAFSPDGSFLASGSYDPVVRLWRVRDGELALVLNGHEAWVRSISYSSDGSMLATASDDDTVRLWDIPIGNPIRVLRESVQGVRSVRFSPDGTTLATTGFDKAVRLWRVGDGTLLRELHGHTDWIRCLSFSPDGLFLASGGFDAKIILWNVENGKLIRTLTGHSSSVLGLDFSPDGSLLASGSVDATIRLWRIPDGDQYDVLVGHSDFVYSVAFSPDESTLISGSADNSVKLWDVPRESNLAVRQPAPVPSNCKACHHPRSGRLPARVIETGCSTCHQNGALVLNWCPALDRPSGGISSEVVYSNRELEGGIPQASSDFGIVIATPGNGEHLYTHPDVFTLVPIEGYVFSKDIPPEDIRVQLELWSGTNQVATLSASAGADGAFSFPVNIRAEGGEPFPDLDGQKFYCSNCHKAGVTILPPKDVLLVVTATAPDGTRAFDERHIHVDHSVNASISVHVMLENGQPMRGVPLHASALLYEWRGRTFTSLSDDNGQALLQVEALSQIPTIYQLTVPPVVVDGMLIESIRPVEITLSPGAISVPPVTVYVRAMNGELSGKLTPSTVPVDVLAIHLPDGAAFRSQSSLEGTFTFPQLPIGRYLITGDQEVLASLGLQIKTQMIELSRRPHATVEIPLLPISLESLTGVIDRPGGEPIPFAYARVGRNEVTWAVSPVSGRFNLVDLPADTFTLLVSAPGFYSQAHFVDPLDTNFLDLTLVMRPETRVLPWGSGQIVLPPETRLIEDKLRLTLDKGWLWGHGGDGVEPLRISLETGDIEIKSGRFAVEQLPMQDPWFFLIDGQAEFQGKEDFKKVAISEGQMVVLTAVLPVPIPFDPSVLAALHPVKSPPLEDHWEPALSAQIRDRLARIGISTVQLMTFITYIMAFLTLLGIPVLALHWLIQHRKERNHD